MHVLLFADMGLDVRLFVCAALLLPFVVVQVKQFSGVVFPECIGYNCNLHERFDVFWFLNPPFESVVLTVFT